MGNASAKMHRRMTSIDDVLGADHQRLDAVLTELEAAIGAKSTAAAGPLKSFAAGLRRHMAWENEHLFPAVRARATAAQQRSIDSLIIDHERLSETLAELEASVAGADFIPARDQAAWLRKLLQGHNYDEEHGAYVEADRYLTDDERKDLIARF